MNSYDLPTYYIINGNRYNIRNKGDYRVILDLIKALSDPNLDEEEKIIVTLELFYDNFNDIKEEDVKEAIKMAFDFVDGGVGDKPSGPPQKPVMDWEQDFKWIVSPINRVLGTEIRSLDYLHWWSFLSAYYEIGDCFFAQIVGIRTKKNKGKKLEKYEETFYKDNINYITLKTKTTDEEDALIKEALGY